MRKPLHGSLTDTCLLLQSQPDKHDAWMGTETKCCQRERRVWARCDRHSSVSQLLLSVQSTDKSLLFADDTQIDQPDTPAPVFAVRALKSALFGTPAPQGHHAEHETGDMAAQKELGTVDSGTSDAKSPAKPPGILLTPGTGTTRRKRVSFGHDVKAGVAGQQGLLEEGAGKSPSLFVGKDGDGKKTRPKSRLTQALENARKHKNPPVTGLEARDSAPGATQGKDVREDVGDLERDPDVTIDLNEPHSRSGKYWKTCFETYHADAKAEMEKLVKYKQLAKSYAKMKDSEALDLQQKLKEEQERVKRMEARISETTRLVASGAKDNGGAYDDTMVADLAKQTALAVEYREQVRELEELLKDGSDHESEDKPKRRRQGASPRTQRTLLETQRELRKARVQVREIGRLKDEVNRLRSDLLFAEQRTAKLADENKKLAGDLSQKSSRALDLERKLEESRAEARQKDRELRRLKSEHDQLKENAKTRFVEAEHVVQKKNEKISSLKDELRTLKTETEPKRPARTKDLETAWKTDRENIKPKDRATADDEPKKLRDTLDSVRQASLSKGLKIQPTSSDTRSGSGSNSKACEDETLISSRALRERIQADFRKSSSSSVLSDRGNLQDIRRTNSGSSSRHSFPSKENTPATTLEPSLPTHPRISKVGPGVGDNTNGLRRKPSKGYSEQRKVPAARPSSAGSDTGHIDLVHGNFARLGGPDANASTAWSINTSRVASLPADRRAAAIARLERKKAERSRSHSHSERNKENMLLS